MEAESRAVSSIVNSSHDKVFTQVLSVKICRPINLLPWLETFRRMYAFLVSLLDGGAWSA